MMKYLNRLRKLSKLIMNCSFHWILKNLCEVNICLGRKPGLCSRGEFLSAKLMADYLGWDFVDAAELFLFSSEANWTKKAFRRIVGSFHPWTESLYRVLRCSDGKLTTFHGGSDIQAHFWLRWKQHCVKIGPMCRDF